MLTNKLSELDIAVQIYEKLELNYIFSEGSWSDTFQQNRLYPLDERKLKLR